jgi:hypothetical protein
MAKIMLEFPDSVDMKEWDGLLLTHTPSLMIQAMLQEAVRLGVAVRPSTPSLARPEPWPAWGLVSPPSKTRGGT